MNTSEKKANNIKKRETEVNLKMNLNNLNNYPRNFKLLQR
jgi:hypothetical protein